MRETFGDIHAALALEMKLMLFSDKLLFNFFASLPFPLFDGFADSTKSGGAKVSLGGKTFVSQHCPQPSLNNMIMGHILLYLLFYSG